MIKRRCSRLVRLLGLVRNGQFAQADGDPLKSIEQNLRIASVGNDLLDRPAQRVLGMPDMRHAAFEGVLIRGDFTAVGDLIAQVAVKGPSSGGKSYVVGKVLSFFPEDAYHELSAMSERALVYSDVPLRHRFLVLYGAAGVSKASSSST